MRIKRTFLLTAILAVSAASIAWLPGGEKKSKNNFDLKVRISGLKEKDTILLANYYGDKQYIQDTAYCDASGFVEFKRDTALPNGIYLVVTPEKKWLEVVIPSEDQQHVSLETRNDSLVGKMKVKGSPENERFYQYLQYIDQKQVTAGPLREKIEGISKRKSPGYKDSLKPLQDQMSVMDKDVKDFRDNFIRNNPKDFMAKVFNAMRDPEEVPDAQIPAGYAKSDSLKRVYQFRHYRAHYWDSLDFSDDRLIRTPVYHNKLKRYLDNYTIQHPDSISEALDEVCKRAEPSRELWKYTVFYGTYTYETSKVMGFEAVFVHMAFTYLRTGKTWWYTPKQLDKIIKRAEQLDRILIGRPGPEIVLTDSAYVTRRLYDVKAKYTILAFWEPSCGHCQKEIPQLKTYYDKVHKYGVEVYAVVTENDLDAWKKFIKKNNLNWYNVAPIQVDPNVHVTTTYKHDYDVASTPTLVVLDENKKVVFRKLGLEQLEDALDKRLEKDGLKKAEPAPKNTPQSLNGKTPAKNDAKNVKTVKAVAPK